MTEYIFTLGDPVFNEETREAVFKPEVVGRLIRCKDCKHRHLDGMMYDCPFGLSGGEDFFCAYGATGQNMVFAITASGRTVKQMTELEARARWVCCPMCDRDKCEFGAPDCDAKRWMIERGEADDE